MCNILEIEKCIQYLFTYEDFDALSVSKNFSNAVRHRIAKTCAHIAQNNFLLFLEEREKQRKRKTERERVVVFNEKPGIVVEREIKKYF